MKRFISVLIMLTLIFAILPATLITASAADEIVFDFTKNTLSKSDGYTTVITRTKDAESGNYVTTGIASKIFNAEFTGDGWSAYAYSEGAYADDPTVSTNRTFYQAKNKWMQINIEADNEWVAFRLPIGEKGTFNGKLSIVNSDGNVSAGNTTRVDLYLIPAPAEECSDDASKRDYVNSLLYDEYGNVDTTYRVCERTATYEKVMEFEADIPDASVDYLFVIRRNYNSAAKLMFKTLSLTKQAEKMDDSVKLWAYPLTGNGTVSPNGITDVVTGTSTTVTATANEGYIFSHWQNASGDFVSDSSSYTFTPYTNTVLYAVFKDITAEEKIGVDFYDANRDYLGFVEVTAGTRFGDISAPTPDRIGYTFSGKWGIDENTEITSDTVIDKRISVVAIYDENGKDLNASITVNGEPVDALKYGTPISRTAPGVYGWYRDEKLAGYGETYTYYVWDSTAITSSDAEIPEEKPLILLDDPANGAYMIEYDEGNGTALEAGLIFGKTADITVSSCYTKANTSFAKAHGQFTAKPATENVTEGMQNYVRGYLVYRDKENVIRIIYTDATAITE